MAASVSVRSAVTGPVEEAVRPRGPPARSHRPTRRSTRAGSISALVGPAGVNERGRRGDRPGHDVDPVPDLQPSGRMLGRWPNASTTRCYPGPGWAEHDADEIWRNVQRLVPGGAAQAGPRRRAGRGARHRQPARDHRRLGPRTPAGPLARRSPGRTPVRQTSSTDLVADGATDSHGGDRPPAGHLLRRPAAALAAGPRRRGCAQRAEAGELLFGTMESWLIWNLTGG